MQRYELAPELRKLVEVHDGPWVFYSDVELLQAQLAEAREEHVRVADELLTQQSECLHLLEQCAPSDIRLLPRRLHEKVREWLGVMRGKGWTESEEALTGKE